MNVGIGPCITTATPDRSRGDATSGSEGQIREVLVKWTGFDILSSTWEPIENIPDKFIDAFRKIASVEEEDGFETDEDDE